MIRPDHGVRGGALTFILFADAFCFIALLDAVRAKPDNAVIQLADWPGAALGYAAAIVCLSIAAWFAGGYEDSKARFGARVAICGLPLAFLGLFINKALS